MLALGHTQKDVAEKIGVHRTTVQRMMVYLGISGIELLPRSKLSDEEKREILKLLGDNELIARIAVRFNVDRKTIRNIRNKAGG